MGKPAAVQNDKIVSPGAGCVGHLIPGPGGAPTPAPPMPFSAPLNRGLATSVLIGGKAAAVVGSEGRCQPPHSGLHRSDPHAKPADQIGQVVSGSSSVLVEGKPAAYRDAPTTICFGAPGQLVGSVTSVEIGE